VRRHEQVALAAGEALLGAGVERGEVLPQAPQVATVRRGAGRVGGDERAADRARGPGHQVRIEPDVRVEAVAAALVRDLPVAGAHDLRQDLEGGAVTLVRGVLHRGLEPPPQDDGEGRVEHLVDLVG
jgi:hypothetical protein